MKHALRQDENSLFFVHCDAKNLGSVMFLNRKWMSLISEMALSVKNKEDI